MVGRRGLYEEWITPDGLNLDFLENIDIGLEKYEQPPKEEKEQPEKIIAVSHRKGHRHLTRKAATMM